MVAMEVVTMIILVISPPPIKSKMHEASMAFGVHVLCSETVQQG